MSPEKLCPLHTRGASLQNCSF